MRGARQLVLVRCASLTSALVTSGFSTEQKPRRLAGSASKLPQFAVELATVASGSLIDGNLTGATPVRCLKWSRTVLCRCSTRAKAWAKAQQDGGKRSGIGDAGCHSSACEVHP